MSTVKSQATELLSSLVVLAVVTGWAAFWSIVARIHYMQGDLVSMAFTGGIFVVPAAGGLLWYVAESLDVDIRSPNLDAELLSS